jgi:hypothetical protein
MIMILVTCIMLVISQLMDRLDDYLLRKNKLYVPDNFMHELLIRKAHISGLMNTLVLGRLYRFCMNTFIGLKRKCCPILIYMYPRNLESIFSWILF